MKKSDVQEEDKTVEKSNAQEKEAVVKVDEIQKESDSGNCNGSETQERIIEQNEGEKDTDGNKNNREALLRLISVFHSVCFC